MNEDDSQKTEGKREEVYAAWDAPSRLFKKRDKEYFTNIGAIVFLLTIILVFAREFLLIAAVLSVVFVVYVLSTVPPEEMHHKITNLGIETGGAFYRWEDIGDFWMEEQWGQHYLVIRPVLAPRLIVLLGHQSREKIREYVARHIPFRDKPQRNWVDNAANWLTQKIPLEKPS
ncbi:MAG: hypothetical protein Q7S76_01135 [bacterium]|nr:hypothetical protein [bacterium]